MLATIKVDQNRRIDLGKRQRANSKAATVILRAMACRYL
jgi:hypothetical protein